MAGKSFLEPDLGYIPPPPPLPKYDPNEEAPKKAWGFRGLPVDKGDKPWTKVGTQPESPDDPDWRGVIRSQVHEYPENKPVRVGMPNSEKYFWFDTPDYADPFKKLGYSLKWFGVTGLLGLLAKGSIEMASFTTANNIRLFRKVFMPWVLGGMAASVAVITIANLRGKKDDCYNYAAGGLLLSSILGRKHYRPFVQSAVICVPIAVFLKFNAERNGNMVRANLWRNGTWSISGNSAEYGIKSGDFVGSFGRITNQGDPGRDVRRVS